MIIILSIIFYFNLKKESEKNETTYVPPKVVEEIYSSNIIEDVNYNAKDNKGNEYIINAAKGEIDISNNDIIFKHSGSPILALNSINLIPASVFI